MAGTMRLEEKVTKGCKICGKKPKAKKMFGFEAWGPHEFVPVCEVCVYDIVTEHLAEENE